MRNVVGAFFLYKYISNITLFSLYFKVEVFVESNEEKKTRLILSLLSRENFKINFPFRLFSCVNDKALFIFRNNQELIMKCQ